MNVAVEDKRDIYIVHPKDTVTIKANDILVVGGNTVHGGITYVYEEPDEEEGETPKYHPSIHFVVQSIRHKKMKDSVGIPTDDVEAYAHKAHMADMTNEELYKRIKGTAEVFCELGKEAHSDGRQRKAIDKWTDEVEKIVDEMKTLEGLDSEVSDREGLGDSETGSPEEEVKGKKRGMQKEGKRRSKRKKGNKEQESEV